MLTCVEPELKGTSRELEQQVTQHEDQTLNELRNENARLKKGV